MKNLITYLKALWGAWGNLQSSDVRHDCRLTVGSPSGLDAKWKQNPFMRFAVVLTLIFTIGSGNVWGAENDVVYKFDGSSVSPTTNTSYHNGSNTAQSCNTTGTSTMSAASWKYTCGIKQSSSPAGFWLGANSGNKSKITLGTTISECAGIATAISKTSSATYVAALICTTSMSNVGKVTISYSTGGTAPTSKWLLYSTNGGTTWTTIAESQTAGTYTFSTISSAIYAVAFYCSSWFNVRVPVITFYEGATGGGCDKEVSLATSLSNCTATFTPSGPVETCSETASDRQVSVSITPTTGYALTSGPSVSGVTGATISGSGPYTIQLPQNGNGELTLSANCSAISVTGVSLNKSSTTIVEGNTETLTATVTPSNALNKAVTWSSGTPGVATVSSSGVVTAVSAGSATITVTTDDGSFTDNCMVTVTAAPRDHFIDAMHSTTGYTGDGMEKVGNYSASIPSIADKAKNTTGTCQEKHYHFTGWVTAANRANPEGNLVTLDGNASNTTYYAVWTKEAAGGASGTESVSWSSRYNSTTNVEGTELTIETNVTVTHNKGSNNNACQYYTTGPGIRVYGGGNFVVEAPSAITAITLTFGTGDGSNTISADVGTYSNGSWSGSATTVTFSVGGSTGHRRIAGISVTYGGGTSYEDPKTSCTADPIDPTVTFSNGEYTVGGSALDLRTLWTSNSTGAVTFSVTNANGTGASVSGSDFTATTAGTCTVQASQDAVTGVYNSITRTATITVNPPTCATPTFDHGTGTYDNDVTVTISCATGSSTIHYTTGASPTDPTCSSGLTGTSVTISSTGTTLKAVACKADYNVSAVASATYTLKCATPTFSVAAGTYTSTQSVELSCSTTNAVIHYTTDGSTPTESSPTYSSAITVDDDMTIKAIAFKTNYASSDAAEAAYRIKNCTWYESFDTNSGNGGNNGTWSGISSFSSPSFDNSGWTVTSGGAGDACIKSGTSGTKGSATTPAITVDNGATGKVKFRMGPWNSTGSSAQVVFTGAEVSTGVSTWTSADAMSNGEWNDYQVDFTTTGTSLTIEFTVSGGDNRFWLDEVCVKMDPAAYTVTFDANGHGTAPDPITDVAKNSTISKPTPDPSATGWTFGGWYKEPACTNAWTWATDQVTSNTTLYAKWTCSNPTSLSISSSGSKYDFCAGESMTLTVSGSNIGTGATYQWSLGGSPIDGATSASYTTTMAAAKAGEYTCTVSNGSCSQTTSGFWVRVWQLYIDNGAAGAWQALDFTNTGTGTGNNTTVALDADGTYHFKLKDNTGGFFGLNSKTVTGTESNITLNGSGANVNVNAGLGGNYTFAINYSDKNNPTISITYPTANQTANYDIWFDKSVVTGWDVAQTSDLFLRIGKSADGGNNKNNTTDGVSWSLVPGTDRFYTIKTLAYTGFEAWHISNNTSWAGNGNSIYMVNGSGYAITKATDFQKYVVGSTGVTIVPTSSHNTESGCNYWYVSKTDGMLTHTATITTPSHGTIHLAYTDINSAAQDKTSTTAGLAHRTKITATATPDPGYELSTFTVTPEGGVASNLTSGATDNHILATNATFAATFGAKTITITWNGNGGTPSKASDTWVYNAAALASLPSATNGSKIFVGWFTLADGGSQIDNVGGSNKPTADVEYFAHWSDGNTVYFNPGAGTVTPASATQTSIGGSVSLPTPTPTCDGWTFQGWKVGSTQAEVTELPDGLVTGSYVPESATVQMYAVYKKTFEETTPVTSTYDWDSSVSGWSGDWTNITQNKGSQGVGGSYCGQFSANGAYVQYPTSLSSKVKVTNFSLYMRRSSNNTKGTGKIQKSTDGSNWTDVLTWSMSDIAQSECTQKSTTFDGSTEYYMRFFYVADGSAIRYIDNVSITYNTVDDVTHYATSPLECSQVATPVITPAGNTFTGSQSITITCATAGATIKYTTDGTDPSSSNGTTIATGSSFTLSCSGTVKAIAYKDGMADSDIASETYTIKVPDPTFSPDGGNFNVAQSVSLSSAFAGTTVYYEYTTDGSEPSDPTSSSTAYSSTPISVAVGQTVRIKAIGINGCATNSNIVSKTFRVGWDFELVTNEDDLNVGDKLVILSGSTSALSTYNEASYNRTATSDFDLSGTTVTAYPPSTNSATTVQVITLDGEPGNWKLKTTDTKWLNCPSAGKLTTVTTDGSGAEDLARRRWSIDIGSSPNYYATIQNNQETTATIQYGTVFAAYATDQYPVKIYSIPNPDPVLKVEGTLSAFAGCTSEASAAQSFYVSGKNLNASIHVAAPTGYEVSLSSGSGYAASVEVPRVGTTVAKTQVYVRLKAGDAGAVAANNVVVSVEANSLSQNVAVPASVISAADTYIDRMHGNSTTYQCGSYSAPDLDDGDMETGTDCQKNYAIFQGWVAASDINLDGTLKAGATVISDGTAMTASGTTYYSVWEAVVE